MAMATISNTMDVSVRFVNNIKTQNNMVKIMLAIMPSGMTGV